MQGKIYITFVHVKNSNGKKKKLEKTPNVNMVLPLKPI